MIPVNDRVSIDVRIDGDEVRSPLPKTNTDRVKQEVVLHITVRGKPKNPETRVIKWTAYGRDLLTNALTELDSGETKLKLAEFNSQTVSSDRISAMSAAEHFQFPKKKKKGGNPEKPKKVEASGVKYIGYSVRVLNGDAVVGEVSDPMGIGNKE